MSSFKKKGGNRMKDIIEEVVMMIFEGRVSLDEPDVTIKEVIEKLIENGYVVE
jgi:phosphoribosyl-ATP pyrophosphohydrolase